MSGRRFGRGFGRGPADGEVQGNEVPGPAGSGRPRAGEWALAVQKWGFLLQLVP